MTKDEFNALPQLDDAFPIVFDNGARWESFSAYCGSCDWRFDGPHLRGSVVRHVPSTYRHTYPAFFLIDAHVLCPDCNRLTPIRYGLHDDMSMSGQHPRTSEWVRWGPRYSWWTRLKRIFIKKA
jgi:hypothetical protein